MVRKWMDICSSLAPSLIGCKRIDDGFFLVAMDLVN